MPADCKSSFIVQAMLYFSVSLFMLCLIRDATCQVVWKGIGTYTYTVIDDAAWHLFNHVLSYAYDHDQYPVIINPAAGHVWTDNNVRASYSDSAIDGQNTTCVRAQQSWLWFSSEPASAWNQPWIRIKLFELVAIHSVSVMTDLSACVNSREQPDDFSIYITSTDIHKYESNKTLVRQRQSFLADPAAFCGMVNFIHSDIQGCDNRITEFIKNVCIPSRPPLLASQWVPFDHTAYMELFDDHSAATLDCENEDYEIDVLLAYWFPSAGEEHCTANVTEQARKLFNHLTKLTVDITSASDNNSAVRSILESSLCQNQRGLPLKLRIYYRCIKKENKVCHFYNALVNNRSTTDVLPLIKSQVPLSRIHNWGLCFWLRVDPLPPADTTVIRITTEDLPEDNNGQPEGISVFVSSSGFVYMLLRGYVALVEEQMTPISWHHYCILRRRNAFNVAVDFENTGRQIFHYTDQDLSIPEDSYIYIFGDLFSGGIGGLMIWSHVLDGDVRSYLLADSCVPLEQPQFYMSIDEGTTQPVTFSLRNLSDNTLHPDFTVQHSLTPVRLNVLKPHIAGSFILIIRQDDGAALGELIRFSVCEVKVELAGFNRKVKYGRVTDGTSYADPLLSSTVSDGQTDPLHSTCQTSETLSLILEIQPTMSSLYVYHFVAVLDPTVYPPNAAIISDTSCITHDSSRELTGPGIFTNSCSVYQSSAVTTRLVLSYKQPKRSAQKSIAICELALPTRLTVDGESVSKTCCNPLTQTLTYSIPCQYMWTSVGYMSCTGERQVILPCVTDFCILEPVWGEWVAGPCSTSCGPGSRTRTRSCIDGSLMACLHKFNGTSNSEQTDCSENQVCQLPPYTCLYECSCYSWIGVDTRYKHNDVKLTCYANSGGHPVTFETELERETITNLLSGHFADNTVWTNGRSDPDTGEIIWVSASGQIVGDNGAPLPTGTDVTQVASYPHLTYDMVSGEYLPAFTHTEHGVFCEKDADPEVELHWTEWRLIRSCDGVSNSQIRSRECILNTTSCNALPCTRKSQSTISTIKYTEYYESADYIQEEETTSCCTTEGLSDSLELDTINFMFGEPEQVFKCVKGRAYRDWAIVRESQCVYNSIAKALRWFSQADLHCSQYLHCDEPDIEGGDYQLLDTDSLSSTYIYGNVIVISCKRKYSLSEHEDGYTVLVCNEEGKWTPDPLSLPACQFSGVAEWIYYEETDICYTLIGSLHTAAEASHQCRDEFNGSSLISITSRVENDIIKDWIGAVRGDNDAVWTSGVRKENGEIRWSQTDGTDTQLSFVDLRADAVTNLPDTCITVTKTGWLTELCDTAKEFMCSTDKLKRNGGWNGWTEWTACDITKLRRRTRRCNLPSPLCGGEECPGRSLETGVCCQDPGFGHNAERRGSGDKEGTVLTYECHEGYEIRSGLLTFRNITCTHSGDWNAPPAYCQRVVCPADEVRDGNYSTVSSLVYNNEYLYQDLITYNCQLGFVIEGTEAITQSYSECLSTKQWSELPIHCVARRCANPGLGGNSEPPELTLSNHYRHSEEGFYFGDALTYTCLIGFEIGYDRRRRIVCGALGEWSQLPPACHISICGQPPALFNNYIVEALPVSHNEVITVICITGYVLNQNNQLTTQSVRCLTDHVFSPDPVEPCYPVDCGPPPEGGGVSRREYTETLYSHSVQYLCPVGYRDELSLLQSVSAYCTETGEWYPPSVSCKPIVCPDPGPGRNAHREVREGNFNFNSYVIYTCNPAYGLEADLDKRKVILRCGADGFWNGTTNPHCTNIPIYERVRLSNKENFYSMYVASLDDKSKCYSLDVDIVATDKVRLSFIQTSPFDGVLVYYTAFFKGENVWYKENNDRTVTFNSNSSGKFSLQISLFPGFSYTLYLSANSPDYAIPASVNGETTFLLQSGEASLHPFVTRSMSRPYTQIIPDSNTRLSVTVGESFDNRNGTIRAYSLIVCETLEWVNRSAYDRRFSHQLPTYAQVQRSDIHEVWGCYQVMQRCTIFDSPTRCDMEGVDTGHVGHPGLRRAYYILGNHESCVDKAEDFYCNGPLKPASSFCVKLRAYTENSYSDTPCSDSLILAAATTWREDLIYPSAIAVCPFALLALMIIIYTIVKWRNPSVQRMVSKDSFFDLTKPETKDNDSYSQTRGRYSLLRDHGSVGTKSAMSRVMSEEDVLSVSDDFGVSEADLSEMEGVVADDEEVDKVIIPYQPDPDALELPEAQAKKRRKAKKKAKRGKSKRLSLKENSAEEEESKISEMSELSDTRGQRKEAKKKRSKSIKITLDIDPLEGKVTPVKKERSVTPVKKERKKKSGARSNSHGADLTHHSDINEGQTT